jgi:hypothetical protein
VYEELLRAEMSVSVIKNSDLERMKRVLLRGFKMYNLKQQSLHCNLLCIGRRVLPSVHSDAH